MIIFILCVYEIVSFNRIIHIYHDLFVERGRSVCIFLSIIENYYDIGGLNAAYSTYLINTSNYVSQATLNYGTEITFVAQCLFIHLWRMTRSNDQKYAISKSERSCREKLY